MNRTATFVRILSRELILIAGVLLLLAASPRTTISRADILIVGDADANLYKVDTSTFSFLPNGPYSWGQSQNVSAISALDRQSDGTIVAGTQFGLVGRVNGSDLGQLNGNGNYKFGGPDASVVGVSVNANDDIFVALSSAHAGILDGDDPGLAQLAGNGAFKLSRPDPPPFIPSFTAFTSKPGQAFLGSGGAYIGGLNDTTLAQSSPTGNGEFKFGKPDPAVPITAMAINSEGNIIAGTEARHVGVVDSSSFGGLVGNGAYHFGGPETGKITAIATDGLGNAFVGLETGHLGKLDDTDLTQFFQNGPYRYGVLDPAVSPISFIVVNSDGNPIIGTTTGWIALLDKNTLGQIAAVQLNTAGHALTAALIFVPEPGGAVLLGMGTIALMARARRRRVNLT